VCRRSGRSLVKVMPVALTLVMTLLLASVRAWAQAGVQAVADNISYNVGETVRLKVVFANPAASQPPPLIYLEFPLDLAATIRYAGESEAVLDQVPLVSSFIASKSDFSTGYREIWRVPYKAKTGRYEVDLAARDSRSHQVVWDLPRAATFTVHRKLLRIERFELDKTFYTSGDPVGCRVVLTNLSDQPLRGLRVEFSERYWPWIAPSSERAGVDVVTLRDALALEPSGSARLENPRVAVAKAVTQPAVQQYAVVVWDQERKDIYDIAFSPLVFIQAPGADSPKPYPLQYVYPDLGAVDTSSYRQFTRPQFNSAAIQFDRSHTMFPSGSDASVKFSLVNPTDEPWRGVTVRASLRSLGSAEFAKNLVAEKIDLAPRASPLAQEAKFTLPSDGGGNFRVVVEVRSSSGEVLASNSLELGANPLPKSILIFCAHEDDEMAHAGIIRAAVENRIPLHLVYFTSGDAGSCDRYYQHSCSPAEALNFGALRMEEARGALGHLGVPRENILFLGLPDGGLGQIWAHHPEPSDPYLSTLLASDHAPYEDLARPNLPYARKSVVEAVKEFIRKYQPEVIYTGHPDERHVDHRTNNWFVVKGLQELHREGAVAADPKLLVDRVYGPGPQAHAPYRYQEHILFVSREARARAQEAGWFYQSQGGNRALGRLRTFDQLPLQETAWEILDWMEHEGWNEKD
jgi:LmbE family N-acetylglucosaminyl deacetylase